MNTAFASPWASRVRSPEEISSDDVDVYRPGVRVWPPRFPATVIAPTVRPAASLYAVVKSSWACAAVGSPRCVVPLTVGVPVSVVPGLTPRSPLTVVAPVLVTVEPARTPKVAADPRSTGAWIAPDNRVMACWQVLVLPHVSEACQVRVATIVLGSVVLVMVLITCTATAPQVSVARGSSKLHATPACTVRSGLHAMLGGV